MPCTTILVGKRASNDGSTMIARTDDGHFTTWDIAKGNGPIENAGKTYKTGNSGYIFWTPDEINFDADYRNEIVIIGEKDGKSVKLGNIVVTPSNSHTLTAVLK